MLKIISLLIFILWGTAYKVEANTSPFRVYVIHSYIPGLWSENAELGFNKGLKFHGINNYEIKTYDYDYVRQRKEKDKHLSNILIEIKNFNPTVIVVFDDEAAEDFIPTLNSLNIPIVASAINKDVEKLSWYLKDGDPKRNFTAILERYPFEGPLKLLKKIRPNINKISILTTSNDSSNIITAQILAKFKEYNNQFSDIKLADVIQSKEWSVWKKAVREKKNPNEAFWILVPWDVYENGKEVTIKEIGTFYQKESLIPELGIVNASQLLGMLLCFSVNSEDLAFEAISTAITASKEKKNLRDIPFAKVKSVRVVINKKRADQLKYKIPNEMLDFAKLEKKIPLDYLR